MSVVKTSTRFGKKQVSSAVRASAKKPASNKAKGSNECCQCSFTHEPVMRKLQGGFHD